MSFSNTLGSSELYRLNVKLLGKLLHLTKLPNQHCYLGNKTVRINPTKLGCDMDPTSDETCFELESCFQIRNFPVNIETTIVKYRIMAEIYEGGKKISRVRFATNNGDLAHSNEKIIQVRKNNLDGCFKELVYLKQGTIDIRSPIKFLVEYSLGLDQPSVHGELLA